MSAVMDLRKRYKDLFEKKHGVKLGFMGLFAKAVCHALQEIPAVNAEIDGTDIVYKHFCHIGVAVGTDKGLVVPVVRDADQMTIAEVEKEIGRRGVKARDGDLSLAEMQGGTFTISNGGGYGSLMSTPILNAPQSGILGMHKIDQRPVVVSGEIVIRPMMYLALSYDHRIVDGKEAVTFLVRVKDSLEDPERLVLVSLIDIPFNLYHLYIRLEIEFIFRRENHMAIELKMLLYTVVLFVVQVVFQTLVGLFQNGIGYAFGAQDDDKISAGIGGRIERAYYNLLETMPPFSGPCADWPLYR